MTLAKVNAIFAAVPLTVALGDCRDIAVAHYLLNRGEGGAHRAVLHRGGEPDEFLFFGAFDRFNLVNKIGRFDKARVGESAFCKYSTSANDICAVPTSPMVLPA